MPSGHGLALADMRRASTTPVWVQHLDRLHLLTALRVASVIIIAVIATLVVRRLISRTLRSVLDRTMPGGDTSRTEARHRALSSSLRAAVVGVIWAVAVITVISELGINIGGFVATATVVGGAIAFGAQTLIRDIIGGFFVLSDDQYGVGDEVDLGLTSGTVERVTLRSARLRDGEGRIWHVQHGNVMRVANLTKSATALLDVSVSLERPIDGVLAAVHDLVAAFADDPEVGPTLLSLPLVVGVVEVRDDRVTVRVSAPCVIGHKDAVKRAWNLAVLRAYEAGTLDRPPVAVFPTI
ncbi:MAG: mechanosensitive ion channel protein MscS [Ilumatobacteraceae bacterium]|nr:mechanosensitive ion channel protein MscS [Ilumatobacteraceae bacterium]